MCISTGVCACVHAYKCMVVYEYVRSCMSIHTVSTTYIKLIFCSADSQEKPKPNRTHTTQNIKDHGPVALHYMSFS